jgi:PKD repeat protein
MKLFNVIIVCLFFLGISCEKKKYPVPLVIENTSVYFSKLTIDNEPVILEAGVNGYYMYSSYEQDSNSVYGFIAELKKPDCSSCSSLRIQINSSQPSPPGASPSIEESIQTQAYAFLSGSNNSPYSVQFQAVNDNTKSYLWDFGDGTSSSEPSPLKTFVRGGQYNVCLTTTSMNDCISTICNTAKIDVSESSCKTAIVAVPASGNTIHYSNVTTGGKGPYKFFWELGDGNSSENGSVTHNYQYSGAYPVSLKVVDANGDIATAHYNAKTLSDNSSCSANYSLGTIDQLPADLGLSKVVITWTDKKGTRYSSNDLAQPKESQFEILSVDSSGENENGQPIKKIKAKFQCKLYNGSKSLQVNDAEIVISVAH